MAGQKFYFAWVDAGATFNPAVHNVMNEDVFSFTIAQEEGDFATADIIIKNPRIGFLNPGRKVWAFLAFDDEGTITPLFYGRLIGIPDNIFDTLVTIKFTARPATFVADKLALAATLKVLPYYDPIFVSPDSWDDPDIALEARSALWHIDRVTHEVTISDILVGEDGTLEFDEDEWFRDSLSITLNEVPLRKVQVKATIPWTQSAEGTMDLSGFIRNNWPNVGGPGGLISSYTFAGLLSAWPKDGASLKGGWQVRTGNLTDASAAVPQSLNLLDSIQICTPVQNQANGEITYKEPALPHSIPAGSVTWPARTTGDIWGGTQGAGFNLDFSQYFVPIGWGAPTLDCEYAVGREMAELVTFTMITDMQPIITLAADADISTIELTANKVSDLTDDGVTVPIGDVRRRSYAHTPRGEQSVQHLLLMARAHLVAKARAVQVSFEAPFRACLNLTLRKNALAHDPRFPGAEALGKIKSYSITMDGDSGASSTKLTIACAIGYGGSYTESDGDAIYITDDYIAATHFEHEHVIKLIDTNDTTYEMPVQSYFDDGTDFIGGIHPAAMVQGFSVENGPIVQKALLTGTWKGVDNAIDFRRNYFWTYDAISAEQAYGYSRGPLQSPEKPGDVGDALQLIPTKVHLTLKPLTGGPFTGEVAVGVADLIIPKQIDLEAASA